MKQIDKLIIKSFIGPFILTTCVVVFIFLMRFIMLYFDEFVGKDLGIDVFAKVFFYFSLITVPISLPLSILLASLMCFGNLGEYSELTALKSSGIPIWRTLAPALIIAVFVSIFSFWYNNSINPWANLKGYSLLWDVKNTKVTLNIKEGIFYNEIPGFSIKVQKKFQDGKTIKGVSVYDHTKMNGNTSVTLADSGRMYTIHNSSYLIFELFNGTNYIDFKENTGGQQNETQFVRNNFKSNKFVFSLESFGIKRTDENQFKYHEYMKNIFELNRQIDSMNIEIKKSADMQVQSLKSQYNYHFKKEIAPKIDSAETKNNENTPKNKKIIPGDWAEAKFKIFDKTGAGYRTDEILETALTQAKSVQSQFDSNKTILEAKKRDTYKADVEKWHKYTMAVACLVMFLIGSSLGSIIKKGGFGMPVLLSITFFIIMYVLMQLGDKYAKEGIVYVLFGVWMPDVILFLIGIYLLYKATNDARLFDSDVYDVYIDKIKQRIKKKKMQPIAVNIEEINQPQKTED
ncbi:MAG: LptF/LptG family permease [Spirosomaceae bacterium]|jgi:lipopolysaccharide export system permease protein|nr:LptF/LptG family permease [Spirosomataceae bacterium]